MLFIIIVTIHVLSCILLITTVLLQSGKDAGLSGAFGLGGGGQTIFGARTGDVLTKATVVFAVIFMTTCILFTRIRPSGGGSIVSAVTKDELRKQFSKEWQKHYKVKALEELGFRRYQCKECKRNFWSPVERSTCEDSTCIGYEFIGNAPSSRMFCLYAGS